MTAPRAQRPLLIACAALTNDLRAVLAASGLDGAIDIHYLPANLHNRPEQIVPALRERVLDAAKAGQAVLVGYADCGTGGRLDAFIDEVNSAASQGSVVRLPGAHCYEFFAGAEMFAALHDDAPGTLYLTDFLAKHFDALLWQGLGLDRAPQLRDAYFGNYTRVVHLAQTDDSAITARARAASDRLGLAFEQRLVNRVGLEQPVHAWAVEIRAAV